jgi:putative membrane protein insertion efficiency factor
VGRLGRVIIVILAQASQVVAVVMAGLLIGLVRIYQVVLRPLLPPLCRFQPSCSEYFIAAVQKYGPVYGGWKGLRRLCRCHPWGGSGYDPP